MSITQETKTKMEAALEHYKRRAEKAALWQGQSSYFR